MELGVMFWPSHDMATSPINIQFTCWIVITLSLVKHSTCHNVSGKGEVEEQAQYLEPYSRSQINVQVAVWDDSRTKEMEEMKKWNKEFAISIGSLRLLECNMPLIHLFKNMTNFSQMFQNYLTGEKIELEKLRGKIEGLELEKSLLKETVAVERMNVEECRARFEKVSEELSLVDKEHHNITIHYKKLEKKLEAEKSKALRLRKDMEYMKNEIENMNDKLRKFLSMESGLDIFVTWRTSINAVILDVRNKHEEELRKIQAKYEKKKESEIYAIQVKIRETPKEEENNNTKERNTLLERISLLDKQLEHKERHKQAIEMEYRSYRESSQRRIRELESELSSVTVVIGKFSTDEISLQSELDTYGMLQEELKHITSHITSCSETMNINERPADTTIRDTSIIVEKTDPMESTYETRPADTTIRDTSIIVEKTDPMESTDETRPADTTIRDTSIIVETTDPMESTDETRPADTTIRDTSINAETTDPMESTDETNAGKIDESITTAQHTVEETSERGTN